jgi:hypothetical protein
MVKKIEILVREKNTVAEVDKKRFDLGEVGFVSLGKDFSLRDKKVAKIGFNYFKSGGVDDAYEELKRLNKEVGEIKDFGYRTKRLIHECYLKVNLEKYSPRINIK